MTENPGGRFGARGQILHDEKLSLGARMLYMLLDDYAGPKGACHPKQATLAKVLGVSERWIRGRLVELKAVLEVIPGSGRQASFYQLAWLQGGWTVASTLAGEGGQHRPPRVEKIDQNGASVLCMNQGLLTMAGGSGASERERPNENQNQDPACPECGDRGFLETRPVYHRGRVVEYETCACAAGRELHGRRYGRRA